MIISSLICHAHVPMAIDCLGSVARLCVEPVRFRIHDDGSLTEEDLNRLQAVLPVERVIRRREADEVMADRLRGYRVLRSFRSGLVLALKLFDGPAFAEGRSYRFVDSDILFLRRFRWPSPSVPMMFMGDRAPSYSLRSWGRLWSRVPLPARVNSGVILAERGQIDLDFLEWFVSQARHRSILPMLEQTAWAALGMRVGCEVLDAEQVRVVREGEDMNGMVAGHFTARSRHLLLEFVRRSEEADSSAPPVTLRTEPPGRCRAVDLAGYEVRRLIKRLRG